MAWRHESSILIFNKFTLFNKIIRAEDIVDIPASWCRNNDVFHRRFNEERSSRLIGLDCPLQSRFKFIGGLNTDRLNTVSFGHICPAWCVALAFRRKEYGTELCLLICIFKSGNCTECRVVHNNPCAGDSLLYRRRKAGRVNAEAAVACESQADLVRSRNLSTQYG